MNNCIISQISAIKGQIYFPFYKKKTFFLFILESSLLEETKKG